MLTDDVLQGPAKVLCHPICSDSEELEAVLGQVNIRIRNQFFFLPKKVNLFLKCSGLIINILCVFLLESFGKFLIVNRI